MSRIADRLAKLEQSARASIDSHIKEERVAEHAAFVDQLRPVAALCNSPAELAAHIRSLEPRTTKQVVSLEARRREDAVQNSLARVIWNSLRST